ncbi:hypothetical protein ACIP2Y_42020 [Streptomyces sviceus]|uniref:hypothetical protein n=1 Tax=Streptomyces sviceus TaxID=285530 RepID=UPI00382C8753
MLSTGEKLSTRLISEDQGIAVESLSVTGLARTKPAKSVHEAGWTAFVNMLEYIHQAAGLAVAACGAPVRPESVLAQREETGKHGFPTGNRAA